MRSGARILVDQLVAQGVHLAFCVPGESYLAVLDALSDQHETLRLITCRHEATAATMAEAQGKLTGKPGICFVTRGPGATHAAIALHTAFQDSSPMILFVGQVARGFRHREAFQELDYTHVFGQMAKWVAEIDRADRIPEFISRAFQTAVNGRPGPVVLVLPEDMLTELAEVEDVAPMSPAPAAPSPDQMTKLASLLLAAERPVVIVGGGGWSHQACADLRRFAEAWHLPVAASFRCQDLVDNRLDIYAGMLGLGANPALEARVRAADLLLILGARMGEGTTDGYSLIDIPTPHQALVHVHASAEELGRVYRATLPINAAPGPMTSALAELVPPADLDWHDWATALRGDYKRFLQPVRPATGELDMAHVIGFLERTLPDDVLICNGAGNYTTWLHRHFRYRGFRGQLGPANGAMGYGLPAAIAAKLTVPDRPVIAFGGDGCFLMAAHELATAVREALDIVIIVIDNGSYGTIRMHQEKQYPGRTYGSDLANPDFAALARSFGAAAWTVTKTEDFAPAFGAASATRGPTLLHLILPIEEISARSTLTSLRARP